MPETILNNYLGSLSIKLDPRFFMERYLLENGHWEPHIACFIDYFVHEGDFCVDVGANIGLHTLHMGRRCGSSGRVVAFEPNGLTYSRLVDNVNLNSELRSVVICEKYGLGESDGIFCLQQEPEGAWGNAALARASHCHTGNDSRADCFDGEICFVKRLDQFPSVTRIDFMKIDVEGMELPVLRGGESLVRHSQPVIIYETLRGFGADKLAATDAFLENLGYCRFAMAESHKLIPITEHGIQEDTLAIPRRRLLNYADVIHSAARFEFDVCPSDSSVPRSAVLLNPDARSFMLRLENGSVLEDIDCHADGLHLLFNRAGGSSTASLEFEDVSLQRCWFNSPGGTRVAGRKTGGYLGSAPV